MKNSKPTIGVINLGCAKNLVDAEKLVTQLIKSGYDIVTTYDEADLVIINTCGFINDAINESLDTIADALQHHGKVIVTGCLGINEQLIKKHHPEVLYICGPNKIAEVVKSVQKYLPTKILSAYEIPAAGFKLTPLHYAYLKISEGCNHQCSFCIIPQLRGKLISRPLKEIMQEAEQLVNTGIKELIIISQDTTAYGDDLNQETNLIKLAYELGELGIWIRLHYLYPHPIIEKILPLMAENKILPYLDVPLQHCNSRILKLMQRPGDHKNLLEKIARWRDMCPNLTIRSTFIVGFPGETEREFKELLEFLELAQLDRVGCFQYSPVEGAQANQLPNHVPEELKQLRQAELMNLQAQISADKLQTKIGTTMQVLIDEINDHDAIGRTQGDAPEIDGNVYISNAHRLTPGDLIDVAIKDADEYDLFG
ncbi:MAG: 30S ribosomal protein S12 methylthiotransferase RimO [Gammaproteobacteria bacterium]|jgi:ribosomal protein S12 methylthiotransferase